jgi:hypothetical protein
MAHSNGGGIDSFGCRRITTTLATFEIRAINGEIEMWR